MTMASSTMTAAGARVLTWRCVACLRETTVACCPPAALVPSPSLAPSRPERNIGALVAAPRDGGARDLLRTVCAGPPLHEETDIACRLDRGRAVWLWQGFLDELLPATGGVADARFAHALDNGHDLVVELPDPSLAARTEVRRTRGPVYVPSREEILTRLWILLRGQRARARRLALVVEGRPPSSRLWTQCTELAGEVRFHPHRHAAVAWLASLDPVAPRPAPPAIAREALRLTLVDCGGGVGRELLTNLHAATLAAHAASGAPLRVDGEIHFGRADGTAPIRGAALTASGVRWARSLALCGVGPGPHDPVAPWRGWTHRRLRGRVPIEVSVAQRIDGAVHVLVLGQHPLAGERALGRFVADHLVRPPVVVIAHAASTAPDLVAQALDAFPAAPVLPLSPTRPFDLIRAVVDEVPVALGRTR